jgi:hypothetical protein
MPRAIPSFLLILLLLIVWALPSVAAEKKEPYFADVILTTSETNLLLFGMLKSSFTEEMLHGLHNGMPVQYSFFVEVSRLRKYWSDEQVASITFKHTLRYDTLKENYKVELDEGNEQKTVICQNLAEAQKAMNAFSGISVIGLSGLIPDASYILRVRSEVYRKSLPMGLHHVVPFVSLWDIDTGWYSIDFNY